MSHAITRVNTYTNTSYTYYLTELNAISEDAQLQQDSHENKIWDLALHSSNHTHFTNPTKCGFCGHTFSSRNQLFRHLGFMNVNTTRYISNDMEYVADTECDKGEWKPFRIGNRRYKKRRMMSKRFVKKSPLVKQSRIDRVDIETIRRLLNRPTLEKTIPYYFERQRQTKNNTMVCDDTMAGLIARLQF